MDDWKTLLQGFQKSFTNMPQALPSGTRTSQLVTLGRLLGKNAMDKILLNVHIATMHLAHVLALSEKGGVSKFIKRWLHLINQLMF
jgi:hypothetical protein